MTLIPFPAYVTEPGFPGSLTDHIVFNGSQPPREQQHLQFISNYQGETDYEPLRGHGEGRLTFRSAKVPWRWSWLKEGERYWNYDTEEAFQRSVNGDWGILHQGNEPVDAATLDVFRAEKCALAVTGYFDHLQMRWLPCEPTTEKPSNQSFIRKPETMAFARDNNLPMLVAQCLSAQPLAA